MKKRENSFFGIHFDFHATEGQVVGEDYRPYVVAELLDRTMPDFVQCDTKGHYGYSSYPTNIGTRAHEIKHDVLRMWRDLTKERDIALYAHHSGIFDRAAARLHPDWAVKDENGNISSEYLSVFGPYADELLIPQLKELALEYEVDGAWIDGECWATVVDYSDHAVSAYRQKYGKEPPHSSDPDYEDYKEFCRIGFESYVSHYVEEIKKARPDFQITSNWMYSAYMPEKARVKIDFLSGDYSPVNSVETARHDSRCLAARNIPWDLMAWGQNAIPFSFETNNRSTKEYEQYCQEAAIVIALGGGFQFFNIMYGGGGMVQPWAIPMWERVASFCREREFCHRAKPYHQIGIIYPMERVKSKYELYSLDLCSFRALCPWNNALLDSGFSTEIIYQSELENINEFPVVILPEAPNLRNDVKIFEEYVKHGGRLIVDIGSAEYFTNLTGIGVIKSEKERVIYVEGGEALAAVLCSPASLVGDFNVVGRAYPNNYFSDDNIPAAVNVKIGKGTVTFTCFDFAKAYSANVTTAIKDFLKSVVRESGFEPLVEISGSAFADLVITEKDGKLLVNIVNMAGQGGLANVRGYNEVPKIGPIKVKVHKDNIKKITRLPENKVLDFHYKDGCAEFEFDIVHIHTVAVIE